MKNNKISKLSIIVEALISEIVKPFFLDKFIFREFTHKIIEYDEYKIVIII